ncbi:MAG: histidine phosphatase family protein [Lachnospiraceae bacterium]|nr:histidine phosphatase family protein [Lachnospiraceae bacterium]
MRILLLRHGETAGNLEQRYVGRRTDEPLTNEARRALLAAAKEWQSAFTRLAGNGFKVYISPMARCRETAEILFPDCCLTAVNGLAECDFGRFEYKNYQELSGDAEYQRFLDSGGVAGFPGGETVAAFKKRCADTFFSILREETVKKQTRPDAVLAFVIHGGTIMTVMERFAVPRRDYFCWQVENGGGYTAEAASFGPGGRGAALLRPFRVSVLEREIKG